MLGPILGWADWLDTWLKARLGRPYNVILGIGLVTGLSATLASFGQKLHAQLGSPKAVAILAATVLFQVALLINQLAQLHHFRQEARQRREARRVKRKQAAR